MHISLGFKIQIENKEFSVRAIITSGTFDAPAKSAVQNFVQFSGFYGCSYCLVEGKTCWTSARGHKVIFPVDLTSDSGHPEKRTQKNTREHARLAQAVTVDSGGKKSHYGVKGFSWLLLLPKYDIIRGTAIDYMHGTLLGVLKMLMSLWLDKAYKKMPWYIGNQADQLDTEIQNLAIPNCISRVPRSVTAERGNWKASEYRSFLLFYSVAVLWQRLPLEYFNHYLLLAESIFLLLQHSISPSDVKRASSLLKRFYVMIRALYGERYQTYNMHNLIHMPDCVADLGPLWTFSCFFYEDLNGDLRHLFHGTQKIDMQIVTAITMQQHIPEMVVFPEGSKAGEFFKQLSYKYHYKVSTCFVDPIGPNISAIGKMRLLCVNEQLKLYLTNLCGVVNKCYIFYRVQMGSKFFTQEIMSVSVKGTVSLCCTLKIDSNVLVTFSIILKYYGNAPMKQCVDVLVTVRFQSTWQ